MSLADGSPSPLFAQVASPTASIIIPVHGKWELTIACLESLAADPTRYPFEVIVVDDCSPDDTATNLGCVRGLRTLRTSTQSGFVAACNLGAASARGEVLIFLNNDTLVQAGWMDALVDVLSSDSTVGAVGSLLLGEDGLVQESGGVVWADGTGRNFGRGLEPSRIEVRARRDVDYCSAASLAVRSSIFHEVGGFDPRFTPAYYEDTDLCFAVRAAGHRVVVEPESVVIHLEGASNGLDGQGGLKRFQTVNRHVFVRKWRDVLASHGRHGGPADLWLARNRRPGGMMLIIDAHVPTPDRDSGSRRMAAIIDELLAMEMSVHFLTAERKALQPYTRDLERKGVTVLVAPEEQWRFIKEAGPHLSAVMMCRPNVAWTYLDQVFRSAPNAVMIYDTVDLHSLRLQREADLSKDQDLDRIAHLMWTKESAAMHATDVTFVVSEFERALLADLDPETDVRVLSNIHARLVATPSPHGRRSIVFVGGYRHPPNVDAAVWAASKIMPLVRQQVPDAVLRLVGSDVTDEVTSLAGPGVVVDGWVNDLEPVYRTARVAIAPLRFGAGVKGKVAEAIEHGVPLVGTTLAAEGMNLVSGVDFIAADDDVAFADAVVRLLRDDDLWCSIAGRGQASLEQFSASKARAVLEDVLSLRRPPPKRTELVSRLL